MSNLNEKCPCGSGLKYKKCCYTYHKGKKAQNALILMKSRYSAYACTQVKYIEMTTYKIDEDLEVFRSNVLTFCQNTAFQKLTIIDFIEKEDEAFVTFNAQIFSNKEDISFSEKSRFIKKEETWYYVDGIML